MSSLPTPGGDANSWGTMLNDYLQQALAADGTLVTAATNPYTSSANTNLASGTQPGLVQLAGDIGNTAASPTVVGLQGNSVSSAAPTDGYVLTWSGGSSQWQPAAASGGSGYSGDIDGGIATSVYGGTSVIDCGNSA
ncbi:MAG: hypothetical protein ACREF7_00685 [Candidatus Saccharimonadales bacterium]